MMYKVIKKFGTQNPDRTISWYNIGETVSDEIVQRLSVHARPDLVQPIKNAKVKKQPQRKGRKQSRKD